MTKWDNPTTRDLLKAILALKNTNEAKRFFRDLLTKQEIIEFIDLYFCEMSWLWKMF